MLPMPDTSVWSSSARLISLLRRRARPNRVDRTAGRTGRARCGRPPTEPGRPGRCPTSRSSCRPPKVRWSANRSSARPSSAKRIRTCRCVSSGARRGWTRSCPLMPRWATSSASRRRPVAATGTCRGARPRQTAPRPAAPRRSSAPAGCRRTARGWLTSTERSCGPRPTREPVTNGLDLGQFRHSGGQARRPGRRRSAVIARQAGLGRGLLGFLLAAPGGGRRRSRPPTEARAVNVFA